MFSNDFKKYFKWICIFFLIILFLPVLLTKFPFCISDFSNTGPIGDTIGGIMGPFVAIAAAILTFLAFWVQFKANQQQRNDIARERFENNLFELLHFHQEITNELFLKCNVYDNRYENNTKPVEEKGRDVFQLLYEDAIVKVKSGSIKSGGIKNIILTSKDNWKIEYLNCPIGFLDHYFRLLYRILKYIDDSHKKIPEMTLSKRYEYASIVRSTLSQYELVLLFYNCLSSNGREKFKPLIEKYAIFNNLRVELLATDSDKELYASKFKDNYAFSQDENRDMDNEYKKGAFVFNKNEN